MGVSLVGIVRPNIIISTFSSHHYYFLLPELLFKDQNHHFMAFVRAAMNSCYESTLQEASRRTGMKFQSCLMPHASVHRTE